MSKYNFGYNIINNNTNLWAFEKILEGSRVLELGSAGGTLTKSLLEKKKCAVDIVELDEEDGKKAAQYAIKSVIGKEGNLNSNVWYSILEKEKYDYIVVLDVLEHLMNPEYTLKNAVKLLKPDGKILLSIPNLAHNAVIIELLKNNFPYTKLGLLDNTHVHFFAYETICKMIQNVGLHIDVQDGVIKSVSDTELLVNYSDVCIEQEELLKRRKYGEVYQYLLEVSLHSERETIDLLQEGQSERYIYSQFLINGQSENILSKRINYGENTFTVDLPEDISIDSIRFVPYEGNGLITHLKVYEFQKENKELKYNWTSAYAISNDLMIVHKESNLNEINYLLSEGCKKLKIEFCLVPIFGKEKEIVEYVLKNIEEKNKIEKERFIKEMENSRTEYDKILLQKKEIEEELNKISLQKQESEEKLTKIWKLIDEIHRGKLWKILALYKEKESK